MKRLEFIGKDGSMGLERGRIYPVHLRYAFDLARFRFVPVIDYPVRCPYGSKATFWRNWRDPQTTITPALPHE